MKIEKTKAFECHIFVCVNQRKDETKSCGNNDGVEIRTELKKKIKSKYPNKRVRVSQSGCLGLCSQGPNILIYPQNIHFSNVKLSDVDKVLAAVDEYMDDKIIN